MNVPTYEPLRKRLARFVALVGAVFGIVLAVVVMQRLSRDSLALLVGLTCGVAAMLPTLGLGFLLWRREVTERDARQNAAPATPPVVVVAPQSLPGYGAPQPALTQSQSSTAWPWQSAPAERTFTIVGGED